MGERNGGAQTREREMVAMKWERGLGSTDKEREMVAMHEVGERREDYGGR